MFFYGRWGQKISDSAFNSIIGQFLLFCIVVLEWTTEHFHPITVEVYVEKMVEPPVKSLLPHFNENAGIRSNFR